jgi:hypothetical protein
MIKGLHADHVDASGAYSQKFAVVQELLETGVLKEIPLEFREVTSESTQKQESVPVTTSSQIIGGQQEEFDMSGGHADHYDETGRYAKAYEAKFGPTSLTITEEQEKSGNSWKSFLQQIIAEEKSKLKV